MGALLAAAGAAPARAASAAACAADASAFVERWRQALGRPGGEAIADLTAWPFLFQGRRLAREGFLAQAVPALFRPAARRCLQRARPVREDGRLVITCAAHGYVFAPTDAGWRFTEFFAEAP